MKKRIAILLNILVFIMVFVGVYFMLIGFQFMSQLKVLESEGWENFKYFTVDSNVLAGISSLLSIIYLCLKKEIPHWLSVLKYASVVGVLLTMLVTTFFLAPTSNIDFFWFYQNSNLFFHFLVPFISGISYLFFEEHSLSFQETFYSIVPMGVYGIFYMISVIPHIQNGVVSRQYDFYGFLRAGGSTIFWVVPLMFVVTYLIGLAVWGCTRKK